MARRRRAEEPGASYHVMNRGVARRTIFDSRADFRFYLACLARAVRRGEIEVLAFALMRTHFHLFLRSLGGLSNAMRRVQHRHARRFNRLHRRDGPLLRGRFLSRRVRTEGHTRNVVRYIHDNPVVARVCSRPEEYEWSSAALLQTHRVPPWFTQRAILRHGVVAGHVATASDAVMRARAELVEARLGAPRPADGDPLDASTPERVLAWMKRKARLADGPPKGLPELGARALAEFLARGRDADLDASTPVPGAGTYSTRELLEAGLLRDVSCCTYPEIATLVHGDASRIKRLHGHHVRCMKLLPGYAELAASIVASCAAELYSDECESPGTDRPEL